MSGVEKVESETVNNSMSIVDLNALFFTRNICPAAKRYLEILDICGTSNIHPATLSSNNIPSSVDTLSREAIALADSLHMAEVFLKDELPELKSEDLSLLNNPNLSYEENALPLTETECQLLQQDAIETTDDKVSASSSQTPPTTPNNETGLDSDAETESVVSFCDGFDTEVLDSCDDCE